MPIRDNDYGQVLLLQPDEARVDGLVHELIGAIRLNSNLRIGAFARRYSTYDEAALVMKALIRHGVFHAGTIRTHYADGTVRLLGSYLYSSPRNSGIGEAVAGDMLCHIVGDKTIGSFKTDGLFPGNVAQSIYDGKIPEYTP